MTISMNSIKRTHRLIKRWSSLNQSEVDKFAAMSSDWWDQSGRNAPLHSLNKLRIGYIRDLKKGNLEGVEILDVGCGGGILAEGLARLGANVTAIDPNEELLKIANSRKERYQLHNLQYLDLLIEDLQEIDKRFDIVISSEVIEHVEEPWAFTAYCSNLVKEDGDLIMTTVNRTQLSRIFAIEFAERIFGLLPKGTHEWEKFVTVNEMVMDLREVNFFIEKLHGMAWCPAKNEWYWTTNTDCNYLVHAKR